MFERGDEVLSGGDRTGDRERATRVNLLDLLDVLRGDHPAERCPHVRRHDDAVGRLEPDRRRPGLGLALAVSLCGATFRVFELAEFRSEDRLVAAEIGGQPVREVVGRCSHYQIVRPSRS
jgi:hypothetical protein